jgi:hypothetical protein
MAESRIAQKASFGARHLCRHFVSTFHATALKVMIILCIGSGLYLGPGLIELGCKNLRHVAAAQEGLGQRLRPILLTRDDGQSVTNPECVIRADRSRQFGHRC